MKFIVSTSSLLKQLQLVSGALSSNTVLPILENFLFEIKEGKLTVSATDLQTSMTTTLPVEAKDNGKVAIPSKILMDTLKTFPEQPVTFSVDDSSFAIEINAGDGKYKLSGENGEDFPKIPVMESASSLNMPASVLQEAINKTLFAVSNDELRPAMTGVFCQLGTDNITFVATDAHKLVRYRRNDAKVGKETSFILPKKALNLLKASLPVEDVAVEVQYNSTNAFFRFNHVDLICRLIDERYPDYESVIPVNNPNRMTIDRNQFLNSLKRVAIFSNKTTHQVRLKIAGSEMQISAEDLDFQNEAHERLTCSYEGEDIEIGFNARFLVEMLGNMSGEEIQLEMSTPNRAGILLPTNPDKNESILMLVMPVMLNTYA